MSGAAVLASLGALRSGAGLVTLASPKSALAVAVRKLPPEIMTLPLPETRGGALQPAALKDILKYAAKRRVTALAIGPGLGVDKRTIKLVRSLTEAAPAAVVLDADGLNAFRGAPSLLKRCHRPLVLTPHEKEFERLFGQPLPADSISREALAKKLSKIYDGVLVLKGHRSLVAGPEKVYRNPTGNPGMAKGGSGDVLTGIVAAFLAQGLDAFGSARWAVYFHGLAGDLAVRKSSELSMTASDLVEHLPAAFRRA